MVSFVPTIRDFRELSDRDTTMASEVLQLGIPLQDGLTPAEHRQVERHRAVLSEQRGTAVSWEAAKQDWLCTRATEWRQRRQQHMLNLQREEIAKYRWIESEKARCDLGRQAAVDWVQRHAAAWRKWYEETFTD